MRVLYAELEFTDDRRYVYNGSPFTGVGYEVHSNGTTSCEIRFRDGLEHGPARDYYPSGQLMSEARYRKGLKHGVWLEYGEDGEPIERCELAYDVLMTRTRWNESGDVIEKYVREPDDHLSVLVAEKQKKDGESE